MGWQAGSGQPAPSVSVIIPCYNYGRFLADAVESALGQTIPPQQIIIVDDGSVDDSLAVAGRYTAHPTVRLIAQQNQGAIAAYNNGVRAASGEFFLILSADDRLDPRYLERVVPLLQARPHAGYVYTAYRMFGARHRLLAAPPFSARRLRLRPYINATALFRRAAWEQAGGFSAAMDGGHEDWDFYVTLAGRGWPGVALPEVLFHYRKHSLASRNALPFRRWLGVRANVYRRHRGQYRLPLPLYLGLVVLNQNWLRLRAAPRAAIRRLGRGDLPPASDRACLLAGGTVAGRERAQRHASVLAGVAETTIVATDRRDPLVAGGAGAAPPARSGLLRQRPPESSGGAVLRLLRRQRDLARLAADQRAAIYHAYGRRALPAAAVAATVARGRLFYDLSSDDAAGGGGLPRLAWRLLERLLLLRADAVIAPDGRTGRRLARRAGIPCIILRDPPATLGVAGYDRIEDARLRQLYTDFLTCP